MSKLKNDEAFKSVDADTVRLLNACTNSNIAIKEGEEKVDMCSGLKALIEEGREEGIGLGENKKLREQVVKKVKKGCSADEIAKMLEEDVDVITAIMKEIEGK